jgi:hypothetical protein
VPQEKGTYAGEFDMITVEKNWLGGSDTWVTIGRLRLDQMLQGEKRIAAAKKKKRKSTRLI